MAKTPPCPSHHPDSQMGLPVVPVGPFSVADARSTDILDVIRNRHANKCVAYALHVGGLNDESDTQFTEAVSGADLVYADGVAVVLLAKLAGASQIQRSATTDIGVPLLQAEERRLGRDLRLAILGGRPGVAESATETLKRTLRIQLAYTAHGYHEDYTDILQEIKQVQPDVIIIGLGMPYEAKWVKKHLDDLPNALIFTCGGWLGFLAGTEIRAPGVVQASGLEWAYRLKGDPKRLARRYAKGLLTTLAHVPGQLKIRRQRRSACASRDRSDQ